VTSRVQLVLTGRAVRERAMAWIGKAPAGTRIEFKPPQRTIAQNDRMWAMLTDIVTQYDFGRPYTTNEAKVVFLHACGKELETIPTLDRTGFITYGQSSSDLSVKEMTDLIEFMFAWGAENGIEWSDPKFKNQQEAACG
jgi:hypothetical protein